MKKVLDEDEEIDAKFLAMPIAELRARFEAAAEEEQWLCGEDGDEDDEDGESLDELLQWAPSYEDLGWCKHGCAPDEDCEECLHGDDDGDCEPYYVLR